MTENDEGKSQKQTDLAVSDAQDGTQMLLKVLPKMLPKVLLKVRRKPDTKIRYMVSAPIREVRLAIYQSDLCNIVIYMRSFAITPTILFLRAIPVELTPP